MDNISINFRLFYELRIKQGLTLSEAARQIGVQRQTLFDYEKGRITPSVPVLAKISRLYGVAMDDFLAKSPISLPLMSDFALTNVS